MTTRLEFLYLSSMPCLMTQIYSLSFSKHLGHGNTQNTEAFLGVEVVHGGAHIFGAAHTYIILVQHMMVLQISFIRFCGLANVSSGKPLRFVPGRLLVRMSLSS